MTLNEQLITAAETGDLPAVKQAVQQGADIHANNDYALRVDAENGYLSVVTYLVQLGADIHAFYDWALCCAADNGHTDVVEYLEMVIKFRAINL